MTDESGSTEERLAALEERVRALEARWAEDATSAPEAADLAERFWVLRGLRQRMPADAGGLVYAGVLRDAATPVEWQYGHSSEELLALESPDAESTADRLAALGSPVRLRLLREVLNGVTSAAELASLDSMGTKGQVYHHVRILTAAGWLRSVGRGALEVPPARVIPLLLALAAAR
ncbi:ArsR family transcriptional regulator [Actinoalloteichus sp. AHMU CJ021]|uniref:Helix-turn-helix domain-containing protein n=1 Tax=Actinoalloteichus caeruleus DSM 43889 TaxID=1120930 RepID=A0ABT1JED7_ACTCY|nr:helix-turn-helix domain-containing protein [Actinoalloteichus caeruleus]AUS81359.1 ArsR family transcriptional regulator [Actinoalloteichus sp. AHMU CJ021]MCP2330860.1 Helix-turn-helix domain-containing protein [Actinoalloteichus caeruleus DSM 43889]